MSDPVQTGPVKNVRPGVMHWHKRLNNISGEMVGDYTLLKSAKVKLHKWSLELREIAGEMEAEARRRKL